MKKNDWFGGKRFFTQGKQFKNAKLLHLTKTIFLLFILIVVSLTSYAEVTFYVPFDSDCHSLISKGIGTGVGDGQLKKGRVGKALAPSSGITYANTDNIDRRQGTLSLFFIPSINMDTLVGSKKRWNIFGFQHLRLRINSQFIHFMTGYYEKKNGTSKFRWDYRLSSQKSRKWKKGEVHHIAVTWTQEKRILYFDGHPVVSVQNNHMPQRTIPSQKIRIGDKKFPGLIDEVIVYDQALSAKEIISLATAPKQHSLSLRKAERFAAPTPLPQKSTYTITNPPDGELSATAGKLLANTKGTVAFFWNTSILGPKKRKTFSLIQAGKIRINLPGGSTMLRFQTPALNANGKFFYAHKWARGSAKWLPTEIHHFAVTYRIYGGKIIINIYLDGEHESETVSDVLLPLFCTNDPVIISSQFGSKIRGLRFFKQELSKFDLLKVIANYNQKIPVERLAINARKKYRQATRRKGFSVGYVQADTEKTVVCPGEKFIAEFKLKNETLKQLKSKIIFTLRNFDREPVSVFRSTLSLASGEEKVFRIPLSAKKRGPYILEAAWENQGKRQFADVSSFSVWKQTQKPNPNTFFGHHVNTFRESFIKQAEKLGQNYLRNHNSTQITWWNRVQPDPGKYKWTLDAQMNFLRKRNMRIFGQIFTTPWWAASGGPKTKKKGYNPCWIPDLKLFADYVRKTVTHYKNDICCWEIWNEPEVGLFWRGTPEKFAMLVQIAIREAKKANPNCRIAVAGHTVSAWNWHIRAAKAGLYKGADIISLHFNPGRADVQAENHLETCAQIIKHFQSLAIRYGNGKKLEIWNSEGGAPASTFYKNLDLPQLPKLEKRPPLDVRRAAMNLVKGTVAFMKLGIKKHFIYTQSPLRLYAPTLHYNNCMLDVNLSPKPTLMARTAMQEQLDYFSYYADWYSGGNTRFWAYAFASADHSVTKLLLFTGENGKLNVKLSLPGKLRRAFDMFGNLIQVNPQSLLVREQPFYMEVNASPAQTMEAVRKAKITILRKPDAVTIKKKNEGHCVPLQPDYASPSENPAKLFTVDIRKFCNMGFADIRKGDGKGGWTDEGDMNDLRGFKSGKHRYFDVPFDIIDPTKNNGLAVITLRGQALTPMFPSEIKGIPINRKAWKLYFLHAAGWGTPGNIADYVIHYTDGTSAVFTVNIPLHCNNWYTAPKPDELARTIPVKVSNTLSGKAQWRYLRIYEWENPHKNKKIRSIDLRSLNGKQTPIIIAISGV